MAEKRRRNTEAGSYRKFVTYMAMVVCSYGVSQNIARRSRLKKVQRLEVLETRVKVGILLILWHADVDDYKALLPTTRNWKR